MESLALKEIWVRWESLDYKENISQTFHLKNWSAGNQKESCEAFAALEVYALNNQLLFFLYFFSDWDDTVKYERNTVSANEFKWNQNCRNVL